MNAKSAPKLLIDAAASLRDEVDKLSFASPVTHVYNPLQYAWNAHCDYLNRVPQKGVRVLMLGMNPGPWGMAQTGVPFGEVAAVRDWMGIHADVQRPDQENEKRPIEGFECARSEVSGRRLWGLFAERFCDPSAFFAEHFVSNYCPLVFMEASGKNRTPDKLPAQEREPLNALCDQHLAAVIDALKPEHLVAVGTFAESCLKRVTSQTDCDAQLSRVLHPSPASPAANKDWAGKATEQLKAAGVW
ncbi:MAG: uracil-DNA glycosylase family protein [Planctomycetota bacterium]